jgi:flagellar biosynthesis/type III secretory pathway ATPase
MTTAATERAARWRRYLADLEAHAAVPRPLVSEGMLVRVTGLVLEAAGVRAPVGSVCEAVPPAAHRSPPRSWASIAIAPTRCPPAMCTACRAARA